MRFIFKLLATPIVCALTLTSVLCSFALAVSDAVLAAVSSAVFILALVMMFTVSVPGGIAWLIVAFLISPYGLPGLAEWLVGILDNVNGALKNFILG